MQSENPRQTDENEPESAQSISVEPEEGSTPDVTPPANLSETVLPVEDESPEQDTQVVKDLAPEFSRPANADAAPDINGTGEIPGPLASSSVPQENIFEQLVEKPDVAPAPGHFRLPGAPTETENSLSESYPYSDPRDSTPFIPTPPPMSSPTSPESPLAAQPPAAKQAEVQNEPKGLLDLHDSEELVLEVDSGDDGRFVLTSHRLIYQGRAAEGALFSAAAVEDVTAIEFGRRPRDARGAWWGVVGLIAAIAVWQVTTNEKVGAVAGAVVAGISLLLLADYWFRPTGLILRFGTPGGKIEGPVSGKRVRDAERLAARVQQMKMPLSGRSANKAGHPPGGSPGLH